MTLFFLPICFFSVVTTEVSALKCALELNACTIHDEDPFIGLDEEDLGEDYEEDEALIGDDELLPNYIAS